MHLIALHGVLDCLHAFALTLLGYLQSSASASAKNDNWTTIMCAAVTIVYGFLEVAAGAPFVGPLGLSILWTIYHALAPWLLLYYSILPFQHEVVEKKCWYLMGRTMFNTLCNVAFVMSFGCFTAAVVLAFIAGEDAFKGNQLSGHLGVKYTFTHL